MEEKFRISEKENDNELSLNQRIAQFAIVGVTFDNRQELLKEVYQDNMANPGVIIPLQLIPEPSNQYDSNAVKINTLDGRNLGYVSKDFNVDVLTILKSIQKVYIHKIYMNHKRIFNCLVRIEYNI